MGMWSQHPLSAPAWFSALMTSNRSPAHPCIAFQKNPNPGHRSSQKAEQCHAHVPEVLIVPLDHRSQHQDPILKLIPSLSPGITIHCSQVGLRWVKALQIYEERSQEQKSQQGVRTKRNSSRGVLLKCNAAAERGAIPADPTRSSMSLQDLGPDSSSHCHTQRPPTAGEVFKEMGENM